MISLRSLPVILVGAFLIGAGCCLFFYLVFSNGQIPPQARLFDFWIPLVILFFMLLLIRARKEEPVFHFWEGLMAGNLMLWLGGFFSGLFIYLLSKVSPGFFDTFISSSVRYLIESDRFAAPALKVKDIGVQVDRLKSMKPEAFIWDEFIKKVYYSFLLVPFVSVILRRK
jgi:hypothetical protein